MQSTLGKLHSEVLENKSLQREKTELEEAKLDLRQQLEKLQNSDRAPMNQSRDTGLEGVASVKDKMGNILGDIMDIDTNLRKINQKIASSYDPGQSIRAVYDR